MIHLADQAGLGGAGLLLPFVDGDQEALELLIQFD
jgi:hypothetical protein